MTTVLYAAGAYNLGCGLFVLLFPNGPFAWAGMALPNYPAIVQCLAMVIGVYGVGYVIAARNPARHWAIVLVGLLGKIFGPIGFAWSAANGEFPWSAGLMILANDIVWWLPFTAILLYAAKANDPPPTDLGSLRDEMTRAKTSSGESLWDLSHRQRLLVVFVRHAGCTFCRESVHDVGAQADAIQAAGAKPVIVHMGTESDGRQLMTWSGRNDIESVSDPDRRLFRAFELNFGTLWQLAGPHVIYRALFGGPLLRFGFGKMIGHGMQLGGAFLVENGRILHACRFQTTADRPDYTQLACAISSTMPSQGVSSASAPSVPKKPSPG